MCCVIRGTFTGQDIIEAIYDISGNASYQENHTFTESRYRIGQKSCRYWHNFTIVADDDTLIDPYQDYTKITVVHYLWKGQDVDILKDPDIAKEEREKILFNFVDMLAESLRIPTVEDGLN